jgi:hypothetical protein
LFCGRDKARDCQYAGKNSDLPNHGSFLNRTH